jgi:acetoin utilization deacetylase AcuC-like enzyme
MKVLFHKKFLEHNIDSEAEGAYRVLSFADSYEVPEFDGEPFLGLVHTERYIREIRRACEDSEYMAEIYLTPESWEAACLAVGTTIQASENGDFAVVRPPGHHAGRERAAGFCLFNNIAIATQRLVNLGKRVFIFDIDGHHGDGTQSIFYDTDKVLYCSIHQHYAYPFSGFPDERGEREGYGYTYNLPLIAGSGDKEFLEAVDKAIIRGRSFAPDVVGVSVGFDAYQKDKLLGLQVSARSYYECAFRLRRSFSDIFAVLEGGYHEDLKELTLRFIEGIHNGALPPALKWDTEMSIG